MNQVLFGAALIQFLLDSNKMSFFFYYLLALFIAIWAMFSQQQRNYIDHYAIKNGEKHRGYVAKLEVQIGIGYLLLRHCLRYNFIQLVIHFI